MDMNEIKEIFFQECEEQLAELESGLLKLNDGDRDPETVNAVFRAVHSIKGALVRSGWMISCRSHMCSRRHSTAFDPTGWSPIRTF